MWRPKVWITPDWVVGEGNKAIYEAGADAALIALWAKPIDIKSYDEYLALCYKGTVCFIPDDEEAL